MSDKYKSNDISIFANRDIEQVKLSAIDYSQIIAIFIDDAKLTGFARSYCEHSLNTTQSLVEIKFRQNLKISAVHFGNDRTIEIENFKQYRDLPNHNTHEILHMHANPFFQMLTIEGVAALKEFVKSKHDTCITFIASVENTSVETLNTALGNLVQLAAANKLIFIMYISKASEAAKSIFRHFIAEEVHVGACEVDRAANAAMTMVCPNIESLHYQSRGKFMIQIRTLPSGLEFKVTDFISESSEVRTMIKLRSGGKTLDAIAKFMDLSKATVQRTLAPFDIPKRIGNKKSDSVNKENRISKEVLEKKSNVAKVSETRKRR